MSNNYSHPPTKPETLFKPEHGTYTLASLLASPSVPLPPCSGRLLDELLLTLGGGYLNEEELFKLIGPELFTHPRAFYNELLSKSDLPIKKVPRHLQAAMGGARFD
jgi:hypothetical protein